MNNVKVCNTGTILTYLALLLECLAFGSEQKRILLNDPTYVQQQLDQLQIEIQNLHVKINTQQNLITVQQNEIAELQTKATTNLGAYWCFQCYFECQNLKVYNTDLREILGCKFELLSYITWTLILYSVILFCELNCTYIL